MANFDKMWVIGKNKNPAGFIKLKGSESLNAKLIINYLT